MEEGKLIVEALQGSLVVVGRYVKGIVGGDEPIIIGSFEGEGAKTWEALGNNSSGDKL